ARAAAPGGNGQQAVAGGPAMETKLSAADRGPTGPSEAAQPSSIETVESVQRTAAAEVAAALDLRPHQPPREPVQIQPKPKVKGEFARSVDELRNSLHSYAGQLSRLDQQMREQAGRDDAEQVKHTIEDIRQMSDAYLREHGETVDRIKAQDVAQDEAAAGLCQSLEAQGREVQGANRELATIDLAGNLKAELARAFSQTALMTTANCHAQDTIAETICQLAEREGRLNELDDDARLDPLTGLLSQAGLQSTLQQSLEKHQAEGEPLSVAMIDVDHFQQFNRTHGTTAGDAALKSLAQLLEELAADKAINARYSGGTFVVVWPRLAARNTTAEVERIRQSIENIRFVIGSEQAHLTVSCSVVQYQEDESREALFERAKATMTEARRYGRNRSFLNEGSHPAPVLPPNLTIQERVVKIA
ncbi:MAG: GGDEF domain-containing protein, partial [Pirellulales bacterium]